MMVMHCASPHRSLNLGTARKWRKRETTKNFFPFRFVSFVTNAIASIALSHFYFFLFSQIFCKVFGVGPSIAKKWYAMGLRTAEDVKKRFDQLDVSKDNMISYGTLP